ncbi:MAG: hypothetical protein RIS90_935 [Pseudomonadota bacterium]|jgi:uncharacterized membrane protein
MVASDTVKIVHVLSACLFLGNVVVSGTWAALAERTRNYEVIAFSNRLVLVTDLLFTLTGAILVVLTGSMMAHRYGGASSQGWIAWSYALFALSGLIWAMVLVPIQLRQRTLLRRDRAITAEYLRLSRIWQVSGAIATVVPLPILYLMITKVM